MRRLLPFAAASVAVLAAGAAQAQAPGRVLSWPGKTNPAPAAPAPMQAERAPAPLIASTVPAYAAPQVGAPRGENRYSPRASGPRMARMTAPMPTYTPAPAYTPPAPLYVPPAPLYAPPPYQPPVAAVPAPIAAPAVQPLARPQPLSTITDPVIPDRNFDPVPAQATTAPAPAPVQTAPVPPAPVQAAAPRPFSPTGPRYYSVHREFGEQPDRRPHPALVQGPAADPLPTAFFSPSGPREEDEEYVEERPVERAAPAKPKRKSAKR